MPKGLERAGESKEVDLVVNRVDLEVSRAASLPYPMTKQSKC